MNHIPKPYMYVAQGEGWSLTSDLDQPGIAGHTLDEGFTTPFKKLTPKSTWFKKGAWKWIQYKDETALVSWKNSLIPIPLNSKGDLSTISNPEEIFQSLLIQVQETPIFSSTIGDSDVYATGFYTHLMGKENPISWWSPGSFISHQEQQKLFLSFVKIALMAADVYSKNNISLKGRTINSKNVLNSITKKTSFRTFEDTLGIILNSTKIVHPFFQVKQAYSVETKNGVPSPILIPAPILYTTPPENPPSSHEKMRAKAFLNTLIED
jgi:hypothetical protein